MTALINRFISDTEIETRACHLLHQSARQYKPILSPPVPVEEIIDLVLDIPVVWESIPEQDGKPVLAKLVVRRDQSEIIVNEDKRAFFDQHVGVEAYSLAHDLGHRALHIDEANLLAGPLADAEEHAIVLCRGAIDSEHKRREWQAERFASYLLMPKDLIVKACTNIDLPQ
jgi:Zn-dependent peptidase ImmA (M78 family)